VRFLVVEPGPDFSVQDVCVGYVEGLKANGHTVVQLNYNDRIRFYENALETVLPMAPSRNVLMLASKSIEAALFEVWPDWLVIITGMYVPIAVMDLARARGIKVALVCTETPYQDDQQLVYARHANMVVVNDPCTIDEYRKVCSNVAYIPHGYSAERIAKFAQPVKRYASDFTFVGSAFPSRIQWFEKVEWPEALHVRFAGYWGGLPSTSPLRRFVDHPLDECCDNDTTLTRYASTKVSANIYRTEADRPELSHGWAMGPREVELAACKTFFLRDTRPEGDELLVSLPWIESPETFGDQLAYWCDQARDSERQERAHAAYEAIKDRTFTQLMHTFTQHLTN
jgi:hypothetical protein